MKQGQSNPAKGREDRGVADSGAMAGISRDQWRQVLRLLFRFLWRFGLIMFLLAYPWEGWRETYGDWFRAVGGKVFKHLGSRAVVLFYEAPGGGRRSTVDTSMNVGDRTMVAEDGTLETVNQLFSTRYIAYLPTAFLVALIVATPLPWKRRAKSLAMGLGLMHLFIVGEVLLMVLYLTNHTPWLDVLKLYGFLVPVLDGLWNVFIYQIAARFFVPVVLWILVTFRPEDWPVLLQGARPGKRSKGSPSRSGKRRSR